MDKHTGEIYDILNRHRVSIQGHDLWAEDVSNALKQLTVHKADILKLRDEMNMLTVHKADILKLRDEMNVLTAHKEDILKLHKAGILKLREEVNGLTVQSRDVNDRVPGSKFGYVYGYRRRLWMASCVPLM